MEATESQKDDPSATSSTLPSTATSIFASPAEYEDSVRSALLLIYNQLVIKEDIADVIKKPRDRENYGTKFLRRIESIDVIALDLQSSRQALKGLLTIHNVELPKETVELVEKILRFENGQKTLTTIGDIPQRNSLSDLPNVHIGLWRGDITTLKIDAIVNAANMQMEGCFVPFHACIDNVIHDRAGPRLRSDCREFMRKQGHLEETGKAKITAAYCLPSTHVLHTVGPIIEEDATELKPDLLSSSYRECLDLAEATGLSSVAFCCISTGVFGYPKREAAIVALETVREWMKSHNNKEGKTSSVRTVIFNVFTKDDDEIYNELFPSYFSADLRNFQVSEKSQSSDS
jgi:O-acetyl-ADP-ribose deacetylase (regulator of RNase III)